MTDTLKALVVHPDSSLPESVSIDIKNFRDAILDHPDAFLNALKAAVSGSHTPTGTGTFTGGDLPLDTPIFKLLPADIARLLSPAAQKLTKADLIALTTHTKKPSDLGLTVADMQTIQDAFHLSISNETRGLEAEASIDDISGCCCCTPCCCCTAATVIDARRVA